MFTNRDDRLMGKIAKIALAMIFMASLGLAGCGVKGPLEKPEGAPKQAAPGPGGKKPHRSFILDGLI
jgi:predicted small lipoprotein YifL